MAQVYPAILYDNVMRQAALVYSGSEVSGFEKENAIDWLDYSLFTVADATTLDVTLTSTSVLNMAAVWAEEGAAITVVVQYETSPGSGTFNTLWTFASASVDDGVPLAQYNSSGQSVSAGAKVRFSFTGTGNIRQLAVGPWLVPPIGQRDGLSPPTLQQGIVVNMSVSENGSILGRQVRRLDRQSTIELEYLTESWVRTYWEPFVTHMINYSCFYAWDYADHPTEVVMSAAEAINAPTNQSTTFMRVSMPLRNII